MNDSIEHIVEIDHLVKYFPVRKGLIFEKEVGAVKAVDGVSFRIQTGETLGLVGESGCGKTTVGRTILGLYPATHGDIRIDGHNICTADSEEMQVVRSKAAMIFQDPYASLNPRWTVNNIVGEPLKVHHLLSTKLEREER